MERTTIPFLVESDNGHDTKEVEKGQVRFEVEKELKDDKWVSLENEDDTTELLTKSDIPSTEPKDVPSGEAKPEDWAGVLKPNTGLGKTEAKKSATSSKTKEWADKFKKVKSATATKKAVGG